MNAESVAAVIVAATQGYLIVGLVFAVVFVLFLAGRVDHAARDATWGFRILVIPGIALLWPLLLIRVLRGRQKPAEHNAHRDCAVQRASADLLEESGQ